MAGVKQKVKRNARDWAPWAGWFTDPKAEPETFATLPGWRQRESAYVRERIRNGEPIVLQDLLIFQNRSSTTRVQISIPDMLTLDAIRSRSVITPFTDVYRQLREALPYESIVEQMTAFGEGRELVRQKPLHGVLAYIWQRALVEKKVMDALPLHAFWELEEGIFSLTGHKVSVLHAQASSILEWVDNQTATLVNLIS